MFGLGYAFASKVEEGFREAKHYITPVIGLLIAAWLLHRYVKARLRAGERVGPPVLESDDVPLPPDDLHPRPEVSRAAVEREVIAGGLETSRTGPVAVQPVSSPIVPDISPVAEASLSHHPALAPERRP